MSDVITTNMGDIPMEDYLDIVAIQHGFESYDDLRAHGFYIDLLEDSNG